MPDGQVGDIMAGGACKYRLPQDAGCAARARSLLAAAMRELALPGGLIEDAELAVSELATNVYLHANQNPAQVTLPELWVWVRTHPVPELVVSIFDRHRESWPVAGRAGVLDERGKGLSIVAALSSAMGANFSRARFAPALGKRVWCALALPVTWPAGRRDIPPGLAARRLLEVLRARGLAAVRRSDDSGVSVLIVDAVIIWVEPRGFAWRDGAADYARQPLIDLHETAERIIGHVEAARAASTA